MTLHAPDCPDLETLSAHLDGELAADSATRLNAHLGACEACRASAARLKDLSSLVRSIPRAEVSDELVARTLRGVREAAVPRPSSQPRGWVFVGLAAALVVGALLVHRFVQPGSAAAPTVAEAKLKKRAPESPPSAVAEPRAETLDRKQTPAKEQDSGGSSGPKLADELRGSLAQADLDGAIQAQRDGSALEPQLAAAPARQLAEKADSPAVDHRAGAGQDAPAPATAPARRPDEVTAEFRAEGTVLGKAGAASAVGRESGFKDAAADEAAPTVSGDKASARAAESPSGRFRSNPEAPGARAATKAEAVPAPAAPLTSPSRAPAESLPPPVVQGTSMGGAFPQPSCLPASGGPAQASPAAIARGDLQVPPWMNWIPAGVAPAAVLSAGPVTVDFIVSADGSLGRRDVAGAGPAAGDFLAALGPALQAPVPARCAGQPVALAARVRYRREAAGWRGEVLGAGR